MKQRAVTSAVVTLLVAAGVFTFGSRLVGGAEERVETASSGSENSTSTTEYPANNTYPDVSEEELPGVTTGSNVGGSSETTINTNPSSSTASTTPPSTQTPAPTTGSTASTTPPATIPPPTTIAGRFPESSPLRVQGASVTSYVPSNEVQAALFGLSPGSVRSWLFSFEPSGDTAADHQRIRSGLSSSGMRVVGDDLQHFLDSGSGQITGNWQGLGFVLIVSNWRDLTFSLVAW